MAEDWIALVESPLSTADARQHVTHPAAGGVAIFLGITRAETSPTGQSLVALNYEAYPEMALPQLHDLAARARVQWPILRLAVLHRVGVVEVSHPSVIIAVSTAHRAEAFDACRWLIDNLKREAAIWKQEVWADGSGSWVEG